METMNVNPSNPSFYWENAVEHYSNLNFLTETIYWHFVFPQSEDNIAYYQILLKILGMVIEDSLLVIDYHYYRFNKIIKTCKEYDIICYENLNKKGAVISIVINAYNLEKVICIANLLKNEDNLFIRIMPKNSDKDKIKSIAPMNPEESGYISLIPSVCKRIGFLSFNKLDLELVTNDISIEEGVTKFTKILEYQG